MLLVRTDQPNEHVEIPVSGGFFFTEPLPVGTCWRMARVFLDEEEREVCLDFSADRPGLLFLGSRELHDGLRLVSAPSERQLLQDLLDAWLGTPWERVIREKIDR